MAEQKRPLSELSDLTAHELHELLVSKKVSAVEITKAVYRRIAEKEPEINAYLSLNMEQTEQIAGQVDDALARGEKLPVLAGIPLAVKDNICTKGELTTCASRMLENFRPPYNAAVMDRVNQQKMIVLGKTNMDEFAMGSSTENSAFGASRNPWDTERVTGGSSGGSAAAVAAGETILALGSDTGGSIRQPASFCGVVGLKPTYGAVSRYGLIAYGSSLDQIGPLSRDVTDCAWLLNAICGYDHRDSTSVRTDYPDFTKFLRDDVRGMKIGIPREYFGPAVDPEVQATLKNAVKVLEDQGAVCEEMSLPHTEVSLAAYYMIATAEASSNLARYDGVGFGYRCPDSDNIIEMYSRSRSEGFGAEVKRRIMLGTYVLSAGYYDAYYRKAQQVRTLVRQDFERAFAEYDVLLSPVSPFPAFKIGEKCDDQMQMILSDACTIAVNLAGIPALSLPGGFAGDLPVGLQLMAKPFGEPKLLQAAYTFEQHTDYHKRRPAAVNQNTVKQPGQQINTITEGRAQR